MAADDAREKRQQRQLKEARHRNRKRIIREKARENEKRRMLEAQSKRIEQEKQLYGHHTLWDGPFPHCEESGTHIVEGTRRVYFAMNNDTPLDIAEKFGVPVGKVMYDNRLMYHGLKERAHLKPLTVIVLPLEETGTEEPGDRRKSWRRDEVSVNDIDSSFIIYSREN